MANYNPSLRSVAYDDDYVEDEEDWAASLRKSFGARAYESMQTDITENNKNKWLVTKPERSWTTLQLILVAIIVAIFTAILSNLDRMVSGIKERLSKHPDHNSYCYYGVYDKPNINISHMHENSHDDEWGYAHNNGPSTWHNHYPQCGCSSYQSPIDIDTQFAMQSTPKQICSDSNSVLKWNINSNYTNIFNGTYSVLHNGHTISMQSINYENNNDIPIATLNNLWQPINSNKHSQFILDNIHFHWGYDLNNESGSSHLLNGVHFPLEAHFVHYSSDYNSLNDAMNDWQYLYHNGHDRFVLAVVGVFYDVSTDEKDHNKAFDQLLSTNVLNSTDSTVAYPQHIDLNDLLPNNSMSYYAYSGSLTTPNCDPVVRWHVLTEPLHVSMAQLNKFRSLAGEVVAYNWRPPQNNTNPVYFCHADFV